MSLTSSPDLVARPAARAPGRRLRINYEGVAVFATIIVAWHVASGVLPPFLFPSFGTIAAAIADIVTSQDSLLAIAATFVRILAALSVGFIVALLVGLWSGFQVHVERAMLPLVQFLQGVPALCWVIFAVLWFKQLEARIAFVVIISTFPSFYYQIREGVRSVPAELDDMVRALRPTRWQLVGKLILPSLVPQILTAWRLNLGGGTKVTIMAELLSGISGIGYQLHLAQELFRMDRAIAWTVVLVLFVLGTNAILGLVDRRLLRWRQR